MLLLNDRATSGPKMQLRAMSLSVAQLQPVSVLMSHAFVSFDGSEDTQD